MDGSKGEGVPLHVHDLVRHLQGRLPEGERGAVERGRLLLLVRPGRPLLLPELLREGGRRLRALGQAPQVGRTNEDGINVDALSMVHMGQSIYRVLVLP